MGASRFAGASHTQNENGPLSLLKYNQLDSKRIIPWAKCATNCYDAQKIDRTGLVTVRLRRSHTDSGSANCKILFDTVGHVANGSITNFGSHLQTIATRLSGCWGWLLTQAMLLDICITSGSF